MGLISRHASAPIENGDTSSGAELEQDIQTVHTLINGNLENANVKAGADLNGAKFGAGTIKNAKLTNSTLDTANFASETFTKAVTNSDFTTTLGPLAAGSWISVISKQLVTGDGPGPVLLMATVSHQQFYGAQELLQFRFTRDGAAIHGADNVMGGWKNSPSSWILATGFWVDTGASANTAHLYALEVLSSSASQEHRLRDYSITALEFR